MNQVQLRSGRLSFNGADHCLRQLTVSWGALFFTRVFCAKTPRQFVLGYMTDPRPIMLPGLSTALQPISVQSPSNAPNLRRPVSITLPCTSTRTLPGTSLTFEI